MHDATGEVRLIAKSYIRYRCFSARFRHASWCSRLGMCAKNRIFSRPYWVVRSRLWYDVLSVCRLSVVCL